jgi:hypothetical protein
MSQTWRPIYGEELRTFVRGKTVADFEGTAYEAVTTFTDGSALRCTPLDGTVYSECSQDSATVEYEASDAPTGEIAPNDSNPGGSRAPRAS